MSKPHQIQSCEALAAFRLFRIQHTHPDGSTPRWLDEAEQAFRSCRYQAALDIINAHEPEIALKGEDGSGTAVMVALWNILKHRVCEYDPNVGPPDITCAT
jgi:hypothetical protein